MFEMGQPPKKQLNHGKRYLFYGVCNNVRIQEQIATHQSQMNLDRPKMVVDINDCTSICTILL